MKKKLWLRDSEVKCKQDKNAFTFQKCVFDKPQQKNWNIFELKEPPTVTQANDKLFNADVINRPVTSAGLLSRSRSYRIQASLFLLRDLSALITLLFTSLPSSIRR